MTPSNPRPPYGRSSHTPQSARALRVSKAAQTGRQPAFVPDQARAYHSQAAEQGAYHGHGTSAPAGAYRPVFSPGTQHSAANKAYANQTATGQYSRYNEHYSNNKAKKSRRFMVAAVILVLVCALGAGTAFAMYIDSVNQKLNRGNMSQKEIDEINDALKPASGAVQKGTTFDEPFYMLLIGSDRRSDGSVEGARSDTNIVVRVDPDRNQVTMVSIPRDTMVELEGYGTNKFNAALNFGGAGLVIKEAEKLLGIDISHYAEVNFDDLVDLVEAVGGVDVEVSETIDDADADRTRSDYYNADIVIEEGLQHLNGEQALVFARSRAYLDGDFTRTANQRKLIEAIVEKVLKLNVTELPGVIEAAAKCVTTDLTVTDILGLAQQFKGKGKLTVYSAMVPSYTDWINDISWVINDKDMTREMMKVVEAGDDPSEIMSNGASAEDSTSGGSGGSGSSGGDASWQPQQSYTYTEPTYTEPDPEPVYTDPEPSYTEPDPGYTDPEQGSSGGDVSGGTTVDPEPNVPVAPDPDPAPPAGGDAGAVGDGGGAGSVDDGVATVQMYQAA